jgi:SAM-dependent methyltransferase
MFSRGLKLANRIRKHLLKRVVNHRIQACDLVLSNTVAPQTARSERDYHLLQQEFHGVPEYGYDEITLWNRGSQRSVQLLQILPDDSINRRTLEIGCGDGITSFMLQCYGHKADCADLEDWRNARAKSLNFFPGTIESGIAVHDSSYDLVFSYNTFEHLSNPRIALSEMVRVCKPGGCIFISFNPLFASPWGLHSYRSLKMPYPQFLFSESFVLEKLNELGISDLGTSRTELQPLNRWTLNEFDQLWNNSGCLIRDRQISRNDEYFGLVLRYPDAFQGRGLTVSDLVTSGITILLEKPI